MSNVLTQEEVQGLVLAAITGGTKAGPPDHRADREGR